MDEALALDNDTVIFAAAGWVFVRLQAGCDQDRRDRLTDEVLARPRDRARSSDLGTCLFSAAQVLLNRGERDRAETAWSDLRELADRTRDTTLASLAEFGPVILAYLDGRIEEALALAESARASASERGVGFIALLNPWLLSSYLGRDVEYGLEGYDRPVRPAQAQRARVLSHLGRHSEARAIRESFGDIGSDQDESSQGLFEALFEAAILGGDQETARALLPRFAPYADRLWQGGASLFGGSTGAPPG